MGVQIDHLTDSGNYRVRIQMSLCNPIVLYQPCQMSFSPVYLNIGGIKKQHFFNVFFNLMLVAGRGTYLPLALCFSLGA